ncbi:hypothetical protein ACVXHA_29645 [Escherichia coli]
MPRMFCWYIIWVLNASYLPLANVNQRIKNRVCRLQNLRIRQVILLKTLQISVLLIEIDTGIDCCSLEAASPHYLAWCYWFSRCGFITDMTH